MAYPIGMYQTMLDWYTTNLSFAPSDILYKEDRPSTCFLHIDRGLDDTDHHAFFIKSAKPNQKPNVAHAAFEVHDFDVQHLGHKHLAERGYTLCWGVGRVGAVSSNTIKPAKLTKLPTTASSGKPDLRLLVRSERIRDGEFPEK